MLFEVGEKGIDMAETNVPTRRNYTIEIFISSRALFQVVYLQAYGVCTGHFYCIDDLRDAPVA